MRILIASGDYELARRLKNAFERVRYTAVVCENATEVRREAFNGTCDAVVLDFDLAGMISIPLLRGLRAEGAQLPMLVISGYTDKRACVDAFDAGADDFIRKPIEDEELIARVRAVLRRGRTVAEDRVFAYGDISLDGTCYELACGEKRVNLNNKEFQLLEELLHEPERLHSTEELMERFWNGCGGADTNVVWTNIANLRRKLREVSAQTAIVSVRRAGYRLEAPQ